MHLKRINSNKGRINILVSGEKNNQEQNKIKAECSIGIFIFPNYLLPTSHWQRHVTLVKQLHFIIVKH